MTPISTVKGVVTSIKSYGGGPLGVCGQSLPLATESIKQEDMKSDCIGQCAT